MELTGIANGPGLRDREEAAGRRASMRETKRYGERVRRYTDKMERVLYDAYTKMDEERESRGLGHPTPEEVDLISWPQTWPDARCGFAEPQRDVFPSEQTDLVVDTVTGVVYVYHAGRFARRLASPGAAFWTAAKERQLPGAVDEAAWAELETN